MTSYFPFKLTKISFSNICSKGNVLNVANEIAHKPAVHRFHDALMKLNIDTNICYKSLNIDPSAMHSKDATLPMATYFSLMNMASQHSGTRFLSTKLAHIHNSEDIGILSYMLRNARNLEHVFALLKRYINLVSPDSKITLSEDNNQFILAYGFPNFSPACCYQDVEGTIAQFVIMIRDVLKDDTWQPDKIYFSHKALNEKDRENYPLTKSVIFDHNFSGVVLPKNLIHHSIKDSDPKLLSILESNVLQSSADLIKNDNLVDRIRLLIKSSLYVSTVTANTVASALGMSRRTLHRHLQTSGLTFTELREEIIFDIAKCSVSESNISIAQIAQQLGYSDSSAFNRLFKRCSGITPLQFRKKYT